MLRALFRFPLLFLALSAGAPAQANDSIAELKAGGIVMARTDAITLEKEYLSISRKEVQVEYRFRNREDKAVDTIVAFPMPDITGTPYEDIALPAEAVDNFLDFTVEIDGQALTPSLQQRAFANGVDITDDLNRLGVSLLPFGEGREAELNRLAPADIEDLVARGAVMRDSYDSGGGWETHLAPVWTLKSVYWWRMTFEPGIPVWVLHRYKPSIGGTAGLSFIDNDGKPGYSFDEYKETYCLDSGFMSAAAKKARLAQSGGPYHFEQRLSYILTTGNNWFGNIGEFTLRVDKGDPDALVSFCGTGVTKTGPTTFEMTAKDFYPGRDLDILFVVRAE